MPFLPSSSALIQNFDKNQYFDIQINSFCIKIPQYKQKNRKILPKKFLPKNSSQKIPPKKFLSKNSSQKNSLKKSSQKILPKNSSHKFLPKVPPKNSQKNSKQLLKKDFENIQFPTSWAYFFLRFLKNSSMP